MSDFKDDELIDVQLPRKDFQRLKKIIEREEAMDWWASSVKSLWIWVAAGGVLTVWALWEKIINKVGA